MMADALGLAGGVDSTLARLPSPSFSMNPFSPFASAPRFVGRARADAAVCVRLARAVVGDAVIVATNAWALRHLAALPML